MMRWCLLSGVFFFFFNDTATTEIYTLSLHDALPICLREKLAVALQGPAPQPVPVLPAMAARISGISYTLTANGLDLATPTLRFNKPAEASVRFTRLGQELRCPVGLDGVERFSADRLEALPFAAKGEWLNTKTFLLELDRVAGISLYRFKLVFEDDGESVSISLTERTGLGEETFKGKIDFNRAVDR